MIHIDDQFYCSIQLDIHIALFLCPYWCITINTLSFITLLNYNVLLISLFFSPAVVDGVLAMVTPLPLNDYGGKHCVTNLQWFEVVEPQPLTLQVSSGFGQCVGRGMGWTYGVKLTASVRRIMVRLWSGER